MLAEAIRNLNQLEKHDSDEVFQQIVDRFNQWARAQPAADNWAIDPMAAAAVQSVAKLARELEPVQVALEKPSQDLELRSLARQLEGVPKALETLTQKHSLAELTAIEASYEAFLRQLQQAMREFQSTEQLDEVEKNLIDSFKRAVRDPVRQQHFGALMQAGQQLDSPSRLRDPARLEALADQIDALAASPGAKELKELLDIQVRSSQQAARSLKSKTLMEAEFLLEQMDKTAAMREVAVLKNIARFMGPLAENVKNVGRRSGRSEITALAPKIDEARRKMDLGGLRALVNEVNAVVQPRDLASLQRDAAELAAPAQRLAGLADQTEAAGKQLELEHLRLLGTYLRHLGQRRQEIARQVQASAAAPNSSQADEELGKITEQFLKLASDVQRLSDELSYFTSLDAMQFRFADRLALQEGVLLRDLSRWVRGDQPDDLSRAKRLFDWTVRNIQLDETMEQMQFPWETLLFGRGSVADRARLFILLARQQGIDALLLAVPDPARPGPGNERLWALAVASEGNAYLFEPTMGTPIPAPDGVKLDESVRFEVRPATLAQAIADDRVIRQLDVDEKHPYPVRSAQLKGVVAMVEASLPSLTRRMRRIESHLAGEDRMVLTTSPTAQAERLKGLPGISAVRMWMQPIEALLQRSWRADAAAAWQLRMMLPLEAGRVPALRKGRILHLRGKFLAVDNELARPTTTKWPGPPTASSRPSSRSTPNSNCARSTRQPRRTPATGWG